MGISPAGRCPASDGAGDNGDIHIQTPEYGRIVHCDVTNYRPVSVGGAEEKLVGPHALVGTGRNGLHRPEGGIGG